MIPAQALRTALQQNRIPQGFERDVARALHTYRASRAETSVAPQQTDALQLVITRLQALQLAIRRANTIFPPPPPWESSADWTRAIPLVWRDLESPLNDMRERLAIWQAERARPTRRRGAPHDGRFHLRIAIFQALQHHDIPIRRNGYNGAAARVLALALAEADRLDGKPAKARAAFNGTQWNAWVGQHHAADALLRRYETDEGLRRRDMIPHLSLRSKSK